MTALLRPAITLALVVSSNDRICVDGKLPSTSLAHLSPYVLETSTRQRVLLFDDHIGQLIVRIVCHCRLRILISSASDDHISLRTKESASSVRQLHIMVLCTTCCGTKLLILTEVTFYLRRFVQRIRLGSTHVCQTTASHVTSTRIVLTVHHI